MFINYLIVFSRVMATEEERVLLKKYCDWPAPHLLMSAQMRWDPANADPAFYLTWVGYERMDRRDVGHNCTSSDQAQFTITEMCAGAFYPTTKYKNVATRSEILACIAGMTDATSPLVEHRDELREGRIDDLLNFMIDMGLITIESPVGNPWHDGLCACESCRAQGSPQEARGVAPKPSN